MADNKAGLAVDATVVSMADRVTAGGAATGFAGWLMEVNWVGLAGSLLALSGFVISWHFQIKRDRREEEIHRARMREFSAKRERHDED